MGRAKPIMIQGTMSNAGKSLLAAGLCRVLSQDGLRVAPFKSQNMSLNSCVTAWGEEMGRAQVLQAQACGVAPQARMNPVLLKPCSDTGSQVILLGRPVGHMRVREYIAYKPEAWKTVTEAYASLSREAGVMVIEGAGSPAEINLKSHDIVNMAMARHTGAPVLLVADIDRGGAFASLVGTMSLLDDDERAHVAGFLLNKFRGDASLLQPALEEVTARTGVPFLGVIPWVPDLTLPEEDSVSYRLYGVGGAASASAAREGMLDIVLVDLPHISNVTDVDPLRGEPDVRLRVARAPEDLAPGGRLPDMVIVPGSKNTPGDLRALRGSGMAEALRALAVREDGPEVLGICGGLQMLGSAIHDPLGLESGSPCTLRGLELLPLRTTLAAEKTLRRTQAVHVPSGLAVAGYEIHHGVTEAEDARAACAMRDAHGQPLGWSGPGGRVWGSYLHGLLEDNAFRRHVLNGCRRRRGWEPLAEGARYSLGPELDRLADAVCAHVDMDAIRRLLERPVR